MPVTTIYFLLLFDLSASYIFKVKSFATTIKRNYIAQNYDNGDWKETFSFKKGRYYIHGF